MTPDRRARCDGAGAWAAIILLASLCLAGCARVASRPPPPPPVTLADHVLIEKGARRLTLFAHGRPLKVYAVVLGRHPEGPKREEGDDRTPEGDYTIDGRNPDSAFHLSLHVSYPNALDRERAEQLGVPPGGDIMIHGQPNGDGWIGAIHRTGDWTRGCVAVTDAEIEEIWRLVPDGTPVEIRP